MDENSTLYDALSFRLSNLNRIIAISSPSFERVGCKSGLQVQFRTGSPRKVLHCFRQRLRNIFLKNRLDQVMHFFRDMAAQLEWSDHWFEPLAQHSDIRCLWRLPAHLFAWSPITQLYHFDKNSIIGDYANKGPVKGTSAKACCSPGGVSRSSFVRHRVICPSHSSSSLANAWLRWWWCRRRRPRLNLNIH